MSRGWKTKALCAVVALAAVAGGAAEAAVAVKGKVGDNEFKVAFYGFSQLEMRGGEGHVLNGKAGDDGPFFTHQRIRWGANYFYGNVAGKVFIDFGQSFTNKEAGFIKAIKDAFMAYKFSDAAFLRLGIIKTPLGMKFTIPGWNLDIAERQGLEKGLVLERDAGLMLSGRLIGGDNPDLKTNGLEMGHERWGNGFGYDIGIFNPAGRSSAVTWDSDLLGDALAYVGRIHYDRGRALHFEASYGISEQAGGAVSEGSPETEDYEVFDIGFNSFLVDGRLHWNLEYINGSNVRGVDGWDQSSIAGTLAWMFTPQVQGVIRHYVANEERGEESDLGNTYIGMNFYLEPLSSSHRKLQNHKIVVNYVFPSGDDDTWNGIGGYKEEAYIMQWQFKY
jgi:hypothetical protein